VGNHFGRFSSLPRSGEDLPEIENKLGCSFHNRAATNAIAFPVEILHHPVASSNKLLYRLLCGYLERVKAASRTTIVERVEDCVDRSRLGIAPLSVELRNSRRSSVATI
jgi:hypothetical protein